MDKFDSLINAYGEDILLSDGMNKGAEHIQHGCVSVYEHCVSVAAMCLLLARALHIKTDEKALVRGALLHDYFLYDWHTPDKTHRWHGFTHPKCALGNAERDFYLSHIERNMIISHMFPLTIQAPPRCRESIILCIADKICAVRETIKGNRK